MISPPFAVVFDTNAYRNLVFGLTQDRVDARLQSVCDAEASQGIESFVNPWVLIELIARVAEPKDPAYENVRHAIRATWRHAAATTPGGPMLATLWDSETQLALTLTGVRLEENRASLELLTSAAKRIGVAGRIDDLSDFQSVFEEIARVANEIRDTFVDDLRTNVVKELNPAATDWAPLSKDAAKRKAFQQFVNSPAALRTMARALVVKAHLLAKKQLPPTVADNDVDRVLSHFRTAIELYNDILRRVSGKGGSNMEKRKRANAVWDYNIAFVVGPDQSVNTLPVVLITDDVGIHQAAKRAGYSDHVMYLSDYLSLVGLLIPNLGLAAP